MKAPRQLATKLTAAALIALAAWAATIIPANARPSWSYLGPGDFPARVKAIVFANGTWDASNSWCWGKWCVSFPSQAPTAEYLTMSGPNEGMGIRIDGVQCENPVAGVKSCSMTLMTSEPYTDAYTGCAISIEQPRKQIDIRCPQHLRLE